MIPKTLDELATDRVRRALNRPGAYITEDAPERYGVRTLQDRRRPPTQVFDAVVFRSLLDSPGLGPRSQGGLRPLRVWVELEPPSAVGPAGEIAHDTIVSDDGVQAVRGRNPAASALSWLAVRKDASGRPWLEPAQLAAAERLQEDHRLAGSIGRLTMNWRMQPRSGSASATYDDPSRRALDARRRVSAALAALPPTQRTVVDRVCLRELTLREVEAEVGLASRGARELLRGALDLLAQHHRLK